MARRTSATLALLATIAASAFAKGKAPESLGEKEFSKFVTGTPPAVVVFYGEYEKAESSYVGEIFKGFCKAHGEIRCGIVSVDDNWSFAQKWDAQDDRPVTVFYGTDGKEIARLNGPQVSDSLDAKVAELYK